MEAIYNVVNENPDFCSVFIGKTNSHLINIRKHKVRVYIIIIFIIIINAALFFIYKKYIIKLVSDKINFNTIDLDKRIHNFMNNHMSIKKTQEMDYQSFGTDNSSKVKKSNEQFLAQLILYNY